MPRLLASSGGKGTQPRFWARCMRLEPLCGGARAGNGEARTQAVRQTGKSCNGCCMISFADCTLRCALAGAWPVCRAIVFQPLGT